MDTRQNRLGDAVLTTTTFYVLEQKLKKDEYRCKPVFNYIKVGWKGLFIIMRDDNMPMQYAICSNFNDCKNDDFQMKHCDTSLFLLKTEMYVLKQN